MKFSLRSRLVPALGLCFFLAGRLLPAFAAPPEPTQTPPQDEAATSLRQGRQYERVAQLMQARIAAQPGDYDAHLTLGCAYADRAASLIYADAFTKNFRYVQETYSNRRKTWEAAQNDAKHPSYHTPPPPLPPAVFVFPTRDDDKPYTLTDDELNARLTDLFAKAQAAWTEAVALAKTDGEKARADYVRGWGMQLVLNEITAASRTAATQAARAKKTSLSPFAKPPLLAVWGKVPENKDIRAAFVRAAERAPDNALYWQSVGDYEESTSKEWDETDKRKVAAYKKSLALNPQNGPLWAELYRQTTKEIYRMRPVTSVASDETWADVKRGIEYLHQAAKYDGDNALYFYGEAALRFSWDTLETNQTVTARFRAEGKDPENYAARDPVEKQISRQVRHADLLLIEAGNQCKGLHPLYYQTPVPDQLSVAWEYMLVVDRPDSMRGWEHMEIVRSAASFASNYGVAIVRERASPSPRKEAVAEGLRAERAVVRMGEKLLAETPVPNKERTETLLMLRVNTARNIVGEGLNLAATIYADTGDKKAEARAQAEADAYRAQTVALGIPSSFELYRGWETFHTPFWETYGR